jgi:N-formylglutamate amidohydrolase
VDAYAISEPEQDSPLLVEIPHAGLGLDAPTLAWLVAPACAIARDADLYVDELFADSPALGATLLCARVSRYSVDLNRSIDDYDGQTVVGGPTCDRPRGVVWRLTSEGLPVLRERITPEELERRLDRYWRPYHDALERIIARKRARFGFALVLCAHSMPTPRARGLWALLPPRVADVVPGSQGRTTAAGAWIDRIDAVARNHGFEVAHDVPYRGGYSTSHYGKPERDVHAVQLELARRLYMDEEHLTRDPDGFSKVKKFSSDLVEQLVDAALQVYRRSSPVDANDP